VPLEIVLAQLMVPISYLEVGKHRNHLFETI
jgi:hypothetical protein